MVNFVLGINRIFVFMAIAEVPAPCHLYPFGTHTAFLNNINMPVSLKKNVIMN
jgi:hypothetical protein